MSERLIIQNDSSLSMVEAYVRHVVDSGRVSETGKGKQYCFCMTWLGVVAYSSKNRASDRILILDRTEPKQELDGMDLLEKELWEAE